MNWKSKSYYQNLVYARFVSSTFAESKSDTSLTAPIPIGEAVMGTLNYGNSEFSQRKADIEQVRFNQVTDSRELDVAITAGDSAIVTAWSNCIANSGGGFTVRFTAVTPVLARLIIEFQAGPGESSMALGDQVLVTDADGSASAVSVLSGHNCLAKDRVYLNKTPCGAFVKIADAATPVVANLTTPAGGIVTAVLQPRLKLGAQERTPYEFAKGCRRDQLPDNVGAAGVGDQIAAWRARCPDRLYVAPLRAGPVSPTHNADLSPEQIKGGWRFDGSTAQTVLMPIYGEDHRQNSCALQPATVTPTRFTYGLTANSPSNSNASMVCYVEPAIMLVRDKWVPGV